MTIIANPIYDSVFKFLMEDERAAKVLLSALLKKEVRELKMCRNEYTNLQQARISLFRIDFSAKLVDATGKEELVLIELQKTWLATETLRFRQYLGAQYLNKENVPESDNPKGFGLPIISIYILGHKVGDLQHPVVYVRRHYLDYDDQQIEAGVPDPFIESLTHDSVIVQIPYLKNRARNHLERILSVFDQDYRIAADEHLLNINEEGMGVDERLLVNRLVMAAASPEIRRDMQVEDEILSEIETRDTTIMLKDKEIEQKSQEIEQKSQEIEQKSQEIEQKSQEIEQLLHSSINNLSARGMSASEIACILGKPEELIIQLMEDKR
uniref:coiled-coil domain-containing protein n=1 Tax=uncultured Bacteroides sp. TaxID=162156 RepID=UPI0025DCFCD3|nr:hypothetical protein [uncultured Bacteroides sp.]